MRRGLRAAGLLREALDGAARQQRGLADQPGAHSWKWLRDRGHNVNPCRSKLHPAVMLAGLQPEQGEEICVQDAYSPDSICWGCGPRSDGGLGLQSFRAMNGLQARLRLPPRFQAFPGIVNGGVVGVAFDCHGNWTAAIELMDRAALPRPPFTLSASLQLQYHEPTPPEAELLIESKVVAVEPAHATGADKVTVDLAMYQMQEEAGRRRLLVTGRGVFAKKGALRAM